ncbi:hypothetical protein [Sinosporangium siamense]|uniref:Lipoprotein n=1 Tax=Sinosporangium siamense TaxID=1367973 RepID=A0A919V5X9_9ACTN|nr:hypothetical protein [Sinosporangium siamense]GII90407.1 lipoprotein [Sinosporangium siamense]
MKTTGSALALVITTVLAAGCAAESPRPVAVPATAGDVPHGYVEGAEETAEPQYRLVLADPATGAVRVLDLITEKAVPMSAVPDVDRVTGDGRFAYLAARGGPLRIVDSGGWTVDHGDHVHHYRAEIRDLGSPEGGDPIGAAADSAVVALSSGDGAVTVLDRAALEKGAVAAKAHFRLAGPPGVAVPYRERLLVPGPGAAVEVRDRGGAVLATLGETCVDLRGHAVTRRGAVLGCADGALLVTPDGDGFKSTKIAYPGKVREKERAQEFVSRPGSPVVAAKAGDKGVWVLDTGRERWRLIESGPAVAVTAVGEGAPVLTLDAEGVLRSFDPDTGRKTAQVTLPVRDAGAGRPVVQVDTGRAYVNDPAAKAVYEIDYNDDLRLARTFTLDIAPGHMVETGR